MCVCMGVGVAANRANTYHRLLEMEKMFPWGQQAAITSHEGSQEGGQTNRGMGERQHSRQKTNWSGLGFVRGSASSNQHHA